MWNGGTLSGLPEMGSTILICVNITDGKGKTDIPSYYCIAVSIFTPTFSFLYTNETRGGFRSIFWKNHHVEKVCDAVIITTY